MKFIHESSLLQYVKMTDYSVKELFLINMGLTKLPDDILHYTQLEDLYCSHNNLISLPPLPDTLKTIDCSYNHLSICDHSLLLDKPPSFLEKIFYFSRKLIPVHPNIINPVDHLPPNLEKLCCSNNNLSLFDHLPSTLKELYCDSNQITSLDKLPIHLQKLDCRNNELPSLDKLPSTLKQLDCCNNDLCSLDKLPSTLQKLHCRHNKLWSLDKLPSTLEYLYCSDNHLYSLNKLPGNLKELDCKCNKLTSLKFLPRTLTHINCMNNPIKYNFQKLTIENVKKHNQKYLY